MNKMLLAYETGVHIGDGNLYKTKRMSRITYSGNLQNESEFYKKTLYRIIKELYKVNPLYYERKKDNTVLLIVNSKDVVNFKISLGLPSGKKRNIRIPGFIRNDKKLLIECLKGIGDTDFSLSFKKNRKGLYTEPRLELFSQSVNLIKDISNTLKTLGFTCSVEKGEHRTFNEFRLRIYGKRNLRNWISKIGFQNPYIIAKISLWKKLGYFIPRKNYAYYVSILSASSSG